MWTCSVCTFVNDSTSGACEMCGTAKPAVAPAEARAPAKLTAAQRAAIGLGLPLPDARALPAAMVRPPAAASDPFPPRASSVSPARVASSSATAPWNCGACTYQNESSSSECEMCGGPRPRLDTTPDAIIKSRVRECGSFTSPIPGARNRLSWRDLRDLLTTQLSAAELVGVSDPHVLFGSLSGASEDRLWNAMSDATVKRLPVTTTDEITGLLRGWINIRRRIGLPEILDLEGREIREDSLTSIKCKLDNRRGDLRDYSDKWNILVSFLQERPEIIRAVFAELFIPSAIGGGAGVGAGVSIPCPQGFIEYGALELGNTLRVCFPSEMPTVIPMSGRVKIDSAVSAIAIGFVPSVGASVGALTIEPLRGEIVRFLQARFPGVTWSPAEMDLIFNRLRENPDAYIGGTRRKRTRKRTRRRKSRK
jgi:hypothetical protein